MIPKTTADHQEEMILAEVMPTESLEQTGEMATDLKAEDTTVVVTTENQAGKNHQAEVDQTEAKEVVIQTEATLTTDAQATADTEIIKETMTVHKVAGTTAVAMEIENQAITEAAVTETAVGISHGAIDHKEADTAIESRVITATETTEETTTVHKAEDIIEEGLTIDALVGKNHKVTDRKEVVMATVAQVITEEVATEAAAGISHKAIDHKEADMETETTLTTADQATTDTEATEEPTTDLKAEDIIVAEQMIADQVGKNQIQTEIPVIAAQALADMAVVKEASLNLKEALLNTIRPDRKGLGIRRETEEKRIMGRANTGSPEKRMSPYV